MATNSGPIYGKQYIRYAETWEAAVDAEPGSVAAVAAGTTVGIVEVGELRAVTYMTSAGANIAAIPDDLTTVASPLPICGINQAYMPSALAQPYTARQLTVATSGLLLVEGVNDPNVTWTAPTLNTQLQVDGLGRAVAVGTAVTLDGTTPLIREIVQIGGRNMVLVSFA
jgi:hypothetical protein